MKEPADMKAKNDAQEVSREGMPAKQLVLVLAMIIGSIGCCVFGLSIVADNPMEAASFRSAYPVVFLVAGIVLVVAAFMSGNKTKDTED